MTLLFLESVGTTELLLILVVALIVFGPRKLPELSRSLGKGLNEFRRASDEFKRTWEREANLDTHERERKIGEAMLPPEGTGAALSTGGELIAAPVAADATADSAAIARGDAALADAHAAPADAGAPSGDPADGPAAVAASVEPAPQSPHKTDWL